MPYFKCPTCSRRAYSAASETRCPSCGTPLGRNDQLLAIAAGRSRLPLSSASQRPRP